MPNAITAAGLQTSTYDELLQEFNDAIELIYGPDVNIASDTPDGQWIGIFIQATLDVLDLLTQVYNSFDPDNAFGVTLDERCAINGIQRQAGTFTITDISITTSQALNLYGLNQDAQDPYTVQDNVGNEFVLMETENIAGPGTYSLQFQAVVPGAVLTVPNTITLPVTVVLGVTAINNPNAAVSVGLNEETDASLKVRRQQSVALSSQGYYAGLKAALLNLTGMESAEVYENTSSATDGDGVPGHSIWVITQGTATSESIANAIYTKRNAGCGMYGDVEYTVTQIDGTPFVVRWDTTSAENVFIKFTATSLDGVNPPDVDLIRTQLPTLLVPGVYEQLNVNDLATLVQQIDSNALVTSAGFSTTSGGSYTPTLTPSAKTKYFLVTSANVIIIPIRIAPPAATVVSAQTRQLSAYGGFGVYTWSMFVNNSGGSVNSGTGLYTAGAIPGVDTVRVTDAQGNTADALMTVP